MADIHVGLDRGALLYRERLGDLHSAVDAAANNQILFATHFTRNACLESNYGFLVSHGVRLHVHVHVALEPGTVGNHDAR